MGGEGIQLGDMLVSAWSSIRECLTVFDKHHVRLVFITDAQGWLVGIVGELDISKALIGGALPDDPDRELVTQPVATVPAEYGRADALDVMRMLRITELPVVDNDGRVVGVHVIVAWWLCKRGRVGRW